MSVSFWCECLERQKPACDRNWVIVNYKCHFSAFSGYHCTASDYSTVKCLACGAVGRTKAKYVDKLRCATDEEAMRPV